jgi:DNA-binding response OmpR family regulator
MATHTIWLIDSDRETLAIARLALQKRAGMVVRAFPSIESALSQANGFQPDLIILGEGINLDNHLLPNAPIVLLSASPQKVAKDPRIIEVIPKPIDPLLFPSVIEGLCQKKLG